MSSYDFPTQPDLLDTVANVTVGSRTLTPKMERKGAFSQQQPPCRGFLLFPPPLGFHPCLTMLGLAPCPLCGGHWGRAGLLPRTLAPRR